MHVEKKRLEITGVLFTGGESKRMGRNKAFLEIGGKPLLERNLEVLDSICREVLISCRESEQYSGYSYQVVADQIKGKGPMGGLYSVLPVAKYDYVFVAACDMPFLNSEAIAYIYERIEDYKLVFPYVRDRIHPLHAFYHKKVLKVVEKRIKEDKLRLFDIADECRHKIMNISEEMEGSMLKEMIEESFLNVNTPQEWELILQKIQ
jgi:molybdopterin-guanine dinucleotide biosynthesis protein A